MEIGMTSTIHLTDTQVLYREHARSEYKALWLAMLGDQLDEGWRLAYSDRCGRNNHNSYPCHREARRGGGQSRTGAYIGPISTVADSERVGVLEVLQSDEDMLLIPTDSMVAKATAIFS